MHNAAFEEMGINYCYAAMPVRPEDLGDAVRGVRALGFRGVNVTVPHKERVMEFLDDIEEEARFIGAVNTIVNDDGRLKGYNTDGKGFIRSLEEESIVYEGKNIFMLGAGGAARAVGYYMCRKAKTVSIFDVDRDKIERLVADLNRIGGNVLALSIVESLEGADILINATPLGLKGEDPMPITVERLRKLRPHAVVGDLIYKETPLLSEARRLGFKTFNGLGMLLWQGVLASELWTGMKPPHETMHRALLKGMGLGS
jgi:shikimate dehydrogenase